MATPTFDRAEILRAVRTLPPDEQYELALEILRTTGLTVREEPHSPSDSRSLAGLLAIGETPPTDQEVAQWLDEHRIAKYGR